jgi:hypothetical protein
MDKAHNGLIVSLRAQGHSIRAIARQVGLSRSRVHEIVSGLAVDDDTDPDPWDDDADPETALSLFDTDEEHWPTEPFTFVGYERQWFTRGPGNGGYWAEMERWVDAEGASLADERESAEMALYRYRAHVANELEDPERADALAADWQAQRDAYDERARARRA